MANKKTKLPFKGTKEQEEQLRSFIRALPDKDSAVITVLQKAQEIYGYQMCIRDRPRLRRGDGPSQHEKIFGRQGLVYQGGGWDHRDHDGKPVLTAWERQSLSKGRRVLGYE